MGADQFPEWDTKSRDTRRGAERPVHKARYCRDLVAPASSLYTVSESGGHVITPVLLYRSTFVCWMTQENLKQIPSILWLVDVFSLQRLLGHSDLQVMRRYLAQNNTDIQAAHPRGSPVDNGL